MGLAEIIGLVTGILKFLPEVKNLIKILQKSPEQKAQRIRGLISQEAESLREKGRPTWES
jgi:hypothetical protein